MSTLRNRVYSRNPYEAPIMYTNYDTENYCPAKMYNTSLSGVYFELERALQPESDICIKMVTHSSEEPGPEACMEKPDLIVVTDFKVLLSMDS